MRNSRVIIVGSHLNVPIRKIEGKGHNFLKMTKQTGLTLCSIITPCRVDTYTQPDIKTTKGGGKKTNAFDVGLILLGCLFSFPIYLLGFLFKYCADISCPALSTVSWSCGTRGPVTRSKSFRWDRHGWCAPCLLLRATTLVSDNFSRFCLILLMIYGFVLLLACGGMDNMCTVYDVNNRDSSGAAKITRELAGYEGFLSTCRFLEGQRIVWFLRFIHYVITGFYLVVKQMARLWPAPETWCLLSGIWRRARNWTRHPPMSVMSVPCHSKWSRTLSSPAQWIDASNCGTSGRSSAPRLSLDTKPMSTLFA